MIHWLMVHPVVVRAIIATGVTAWLLMLFGSIAWRAGLFDYHGPADCCDDAEDGFNDNTD